MKKAKASAATKAQIRKECAANNKLLRLYAAAKRVANKATLDQQIAEFRRQNAAECQAVLDGAPLSSLRGRFRVAKAMGLGGAATPIAKKKRAKKKPVKKKAPKRAAAKHAAAKKKAPKRKAAKSRTGPARASAGAQTPSKRKRALSSRRKKSASNRKK